MKKVRKNKSETAQVSALLKVKKQRFLDITRDTILKSSLNLWRRKIPKGIHIGLENRCSPT